MRLTDATVLVVDDEPMLVEIFQAWLERQGCRVVTAENGLQGLELATRLRPDVIVSDVRMPVMDGIEMARTLKSIDSYASRIVFVSGFTELSQRECFDLGVEAMLAKPLRRPDLMAVLQRCLAGVEERWRGPPGARVPDHAHGSFRERAPAARQQGLIEFGRGGFCIRSSFAEPVGQAIGLNLEFEVGGHALVGQGIVRWLAQGEEQLGVEITYVDDENRGWVAALVERNGSRSFIPRTSLGQQPA